MDNKNSSILKRAIIRFSIIFKLEKNGRTLAKYKKDREHIHFYWYYYEKDFLTNKLKFEYKEILIPIQMLIEASQNIKRSLLEYEGTAEYKDIMGKHHLSISDSINPGCIFIYYNVILNDDILKETGFDINKRNLNKIIKE